MTARGDLWRRRAFTAWAIIATFGALGAGFLVEDALDRVGTVEHDDCVGRKNGREFLIGYIERHGMNDTDRAEAARLGFVPVVASCP